VLLQQRDGPFERLVAEMSRPPLQGGGKGGLQVFGPEGGAIASPLIYQVGRVVCLLIAIDPLVDAHPAGSEQSGDFGDGPARSSFQDGQGSPEETSIRSTLELLFKAASLVRGQVQAAHETPR
jgi:hypothetical protein